jgi:hypothetical protein
VNAGVPTESQEQVTLFVWAGRESERYPALALLVHIPNGGLRDKMTAARLKREGVKPGFPDLMLPVQRGGYAGLFVEMKRQKGGVVSAEQKAWITRLRGEGYKVEVCKGWEMARESLLSYLNY